MKIIVTTGPEEDRKLFAKQLSFISLYRNLSTFESTDLNDLIHNRRSPNPADFGLVQLDRFPDFEYLESLHRHFQGDVHIVPELPDVAALQFFIKSKLL